MRIGGEAPGRRAQSRNRCQHHGLLRVAATSGALKQPNAHLTVRAMPIDSSIKHGVFDLGWMVGRMFPREIASDFGLQVARLNGPSDKLLGKPNCRPASRTVSNVLPARTLFAPVGIARPLPLPR